VLRYKQVYIYLASYFINAALSFATVSVLTHHLSPYDYGVINLYSAFLIFLTPFISGGILYPLSVEYFKRKEETYGEYFTNAQAIPLVSLSLFTVACILFQHPLARFLKVSEIWVWIIPVTTWWIMINDTVLVISRNRNKPLLFALLGISKNVAEIALTITLVIGLNMTWPGRLLSAILSPVMLGIVSIYLFNRWRLIQKKVDWADTKRIFLLSLPFVFERLAVFVLGYSDKYFIDKFDMHGTKEVGLYGLGSQLATIVSLVVVSMNSAYQPHLFKKLSEGFKGKIHKSTFWYIGASAGTVGLMFIAIPVLFRFFIGPDFQAARFYAYILCFGYFMWGGYNAFLAYLIYLEKNRTILLISLIGIMVSLLMNFIIVPSLGAKGAAITSVTTYSVMALSCFLFVRKFYLTGTNPPSHSGLQSPGTV
jgi:O-antigen/teichoic acid export membrane protein